MQEEAKQDDLVKDTPTVDPAAHPFASEEIVFDAGHMLGGKYKILSLLGSGGMGKVFKVTQVFLNTVYALKVLDIRKVVDEVTMRRFQHEARAANALSHPNLVKVHDFGLLDNNQPYFVMDLVEGATLAESIRDKGSLTLAEAAPVFAQICAGLEYAHTQLIVHRDIKPSNIILTAGFEPGTEGSVKILDFGIAKIASEEGGEIQQLTRTGEVFGSPLYMSPEQCSGAAVDHRSDIYSLGCVLFEALTGTPPYVGANALRTMMLHQSEPIPSLKQASLGNTFPKSLEEMVAKMLQKDPDERYQNMAQVAESLAAVSNNKKIALPKSTRSRVKPPRTVTLQIWQLIFLLAATVVLTATITAVAFPHLKQHSLQLFSTVSNHSSTFAQVPEGTMPQKQAEEAGEFFATAGSEYLNPHPELTKLTFDQCDPIRPVKTVKNGIKCKRFVFPARAIGSVECVLGSLALSVPIARGGTATISQKGGQSLRVWEARDVVIVPEGIPLTLNIDGKRCPQIFDLTYIVDKIDPGTFSQLQVTSNPMADPKSLHKGLKSILTSVRNWKGLKSVALVNMPLNIETLRAINLIEHLQNLSVEGAMLESLSQSQHAVLKKPVMLSLRRMEADKLISAVEGSKNLSTLNLQDVSMTASALRKLKNCPNFKFLQINNHAIDNDCFDAVMNLKQLRELNLSHLNLAESQLRKLKTMTWLSKIVVSAQSALRLEQLNITDSRIKVER